MGLLSEDLGKVRVNSASLSEALAFAEACMSDAAAHYFCFCEANLLSSALQDAEVREALARADAVFPDGVALMILARIRGVRLKSRIPGPQFLLEACEYGLCRQWRHYFYGGNPGVAEKLAARLRERFPGLLVAGTFSPPFRGLTEEEEREVKARIESASPHCVWVCLGSPKQELWVASHVGRIKAPLLLPVGAAFDFHSGERPWAPAIIRRFGLEWLFRSLSGGRRTFLRNIKCVTAVLVHLARAAVTRVSK